MIEELGFNIEDSSSNKIIDEMREKRILVLNDDIDNYLLEDVILYILKWNTEDSMNGVSPKKRKPIKLIINSSGGDGIVAMHLCDVIDSSTTPIHTYGMGLVASAAFMIYICGHERYAFKNTVLLMHDGSATVSNSSAKVKQTMDFLNELDQRSKDLIVNHTKISSEFYDANYEKEYYMYADTEGMELGCVDNIIKKL